MLTHSPTGPLDQIRMPEGIAGERFLPESTGTPELASVRRGRSRSSPSTRTSGTTYLACAKPRDAPLACAIGNARVPRVALAREARSRRGDAEHRLFPPRSPRSRAQSSTIPTMWCSTSIPTSTRGRRRQADEPELNTVAFEKGKERRSVSPLRVELAQRAWAWRRSSRPRARPVSTSSWPIERTLDFDRGAERSAKWSDATSSASAPRTSRLSGAFPSAPANIYHGLQHERARQDAQTSLYSPRGAAGAPVSMPLTWEELRQGAPARLQIHQRPRAARPTWRTAGRDALTRQAEPCSVRWSARKREEAPKSSTN